MAVNLPSRAARGRRAPIADINVTPLVDVMLVLLIIFMVTAPLMTAGVPVNLPDSRAKALDEEKAPITLSIEANGLIHLGDQEVAEPALPQRLGQIAASGAGGKPPQLYLRADRSLDYGRVARVLGELAHAGLTRVALVSVEGRQEALAGGGDAGAVMIDRSEKAGVGVALIGHAALFALLSLRLLTRPLPVPPPEQAIEVSLAPDIALQQSSPAPAPAAPSEAPELGKPEEEAAPAPAPAPTPAPARPAARPNPDKLASVVADAERADAERAEKAAAQAVAHAAWIEKVKAANAAKAEAAKAAVAAKADARAAWVEKVRAANAAKAEAARVAAEKAEATRVAAAAAQAQAHAAWVEKVKAANAAKAEAARAAAEKVAAARAAAAARPRGSRLGSDFLKGLADTPAKQTSPAAPGATMSAIAMRSIVDAIKRQVQPCADRQVNPGPGAERIQVTLNLKLNRDGSLAAPPRVVNHDGSSIDVDNRRYLDRIDDLAIATFVGCAPMRGLPVELYDVPNGWRSITMTYKLPR